MRDAEASSFSGVVGYKVGKEVKARHVLIIKESHPKNANLT